jgi:outer membrane protein
VRFLLHTTVLVLVVTAHAFPQSAAKPLSLDDCIRLSQEAQSSISLARQEVQLAGYGVDRARAAFLPQGQINNTYTYNSPQLRNPDEFSFVALNGIREYNMQLTAVQELDISGRLRAELARARADRDAATASLNLSQRDLKRAVSASFYRVLLARHLVQSAKDALAEAQAFADRARLLFENGEAAQADVFKALSEVAFLEQNLSAAQLDSDVANHDLASFWTDSVADALALEDPLAQPLPALESMLGAAAPSSAPPLYLTRPEFGLLDARQRGFLADARRVHAELLPQASFAFQYGIDSQNVRIADRGYAAFINLNIPVFDWFKTKNLARQFQIKAQQVQITREVAIRSFSREYQDALSHLKSLFHQVSLAEEQVRLSEQNLRMSRVRYEGGEGAALEVVAAQNQLAQARTNYYTALAGCWNAKVDLEVATGK